MTGGVTFAHCDEQMICLISWMHSIIIHVQFGLHSKFYFRIGMMRLDSF